MDQQENSSKKSIITGVVAVAIVVILIAAVMAFKKDESAPTASNVDSSATSQTEETPASETEASQGDVESAASSDYKDGSYTATGSYTSPAGTESIAVTVTLDGGTISDVSVDPQAESGESAQYQGQFASNYKSLVQGKDIDIVSLSRVSGSSLTSRGFNDALDQIKQQAKA